MTVTVDLKPEVEARLAAQATAQGLSLQAYLETLIERTVHASEQGDPTLALFAQWEAEDDTDDLEELAARNRDCEEMVANLRANRLTLRALQP